MDDASSTYVKLCLIICSVFYLILLGSNIETNMVDVCECSMHFCGTFETDKTKWHNRNNLVFIVELASSIRVYTLNSLFLLLHIFISSNEISKQ
jgi:hypothetical protein